MGSPKRSKPAKVAKKPSKSSRKSKTLNRPPTRKIVRWNDDLDRKLLLAIQSACNTLGIRIPWEEVAEIMKNGISDGAIVQHLAKLRARMVSSGLEVPPPLRRGGTTAPSKLAGGALRASNRINVKREPEDDLDDEEEEEEIQKRKSSRAKRKNVKFKACDNDDNTSDDESSFSNSSDSETASDNGGENTAVGAPWLEYPNDKAPASDDTTCQEPPKPSPKKTKLVKLRLPKSYLKTDQKDHRINGSQTIKPKIEPVEQEESVGEISQGYQGVHYSDARHTMNPPITIQPGNVNQIASQSSEQQNAQYMSWTANNMDSHAGQATQHVVTHIPQSHVTVEALIRNSENNAYSPQLLDQPPVTYTNMHTINPYCTSESSNVVGHGEPGHGLIPWINDRQESILSEPRHPEVAFVDDMGHEFVRENIFDEAMDHDSANMFDFSGN